MITTRPIQKKHTVIAYQQVLLKFGDQFAEEDIASVTTEEILSFLTTLNENNKQSTRRQRYVLLSSFFRFIRNTFNEKLPNPCDSPVMKKIFRYKSSTPWSILDKDVVDEIIFKTPSKRNRLILELIARGGMRIGEVLEIIPSDIQDQKILLHNPKSGRESETVFIPQKIAERLKDYIREKKIGTQERVFPIGYAGARAMVKKSGELAGVKLRPHDMRRHAATFASRGGTPIEIISKVILRHANLSTTQRYLGKVTDSEAVRWIENLYG